MAIYYANLALILILGFVLTVWKPSKINKIIYLVVTFGFMWFIATFRLNIGYDYKVYIGFFEKLKLVSLPELVGSFGSLHATLGVPREPGFALLTWIIGRLTDSTVVMYGIYTILIFIPVVRYIYKYCDDVMLSVWLYVTLVFFYTNMNFIRQSLACSVAILGFDFFRTRKTIPLLLIVIAAATFHVTALVIIPIYFFTYIKLNKATIIGYATTVFFVFIFSKQIAYLATRVVFKNYWNSRYLEGYLGGKFIVMPTMTLLICIALYHIWHKRNEFAELMIKVMAINATIWLVASFNHMIVERLCMYTYMYTLYALPSALSSLKASPEVLLERDALTVNSTNRRLNLQQKNRLEVLNGKIQDGKYYYWSATGAVLIITFLYLYSGMDTTPESSGFAGFHGIAPYQSVFEWLNKLSVQ